MWTSKKLRIVTLSASEAEYITLDATACQSVWRAGLIEKLTEKKMTPMELRVNDSFAIELVKNLAFHSRTKHIDVCREIYGKSLNMLH